MNEVRDMASKAFALEEAARATRPPLVQPAPEPDLPHARSRGGAQLGMTILIVGGLLFWGGAAALFLYLTR
jgi:hypothetical protein